MTALPIDNRRSATDDRDDWLPIAEAVALLGVSDRHVRRLCADRWSKRGLATVEANGTGRPNWLIHRKADPRLSRCTDRDGRKRDPLLTRHPQHLVERAYEKAAWMRRWQMLHATTERTVQQAAEIVVREAKAKHGAKYPISVRSLRLWKQQYETIGDDGQILGVAGLVDQYRAPGNKGSRDQGSKEQSSRSPEAIARFYEFYHQRRRTKIKTCHEITLLDAEKFGWRWPASVSATVRWLRKYDDLAKTCLFRDGPAAWTRKYMPYNEIDYSAWEPGQFYQLDHSQLDLWCFHGTEQIRPWLSVVQDIRSRAIVGWHVGPSPHQDAILCGVRMAFNQWAIPERMRIDNGKDYTSRLLLGDLSDAQLRQLRDEYGRDWHRVVKRDANLVPLEDSRFLGIVNELGIECTKAIPYSPWSKGITERLFGTVHDQFDKTFATYCGNSTLSRPECLQQIRRGYTDSQKRSLRRKFGREWKKVAVLKIVDQSHIPTMDDIREQFAEWVELYHRSAHSGEGMNGASPLAVWSTATRLRRAVEDELMFLLDMRGTYKVGPNGVRIKVGSVTISYDGPCLSKLRGRKVAIALHNQEVSQAYAFDDQGDRRRFLGKLRANEKIPYGSDADDVREAIAEKRREQGAIRKASRLQVNRFKSTSQRLREHRQDKLASLRATGTGDAGPSFQSASIQPVVTGIEGVSTGLRKSAGGPTFPPVNERDYGPADLVPDAADQADDDEWEDFDDAPVPGHSGHDDFDDDEWEDFDEDTAGDDDGGVGDLYDD